MDPTATLTRFFGEVAENDHKEALEALEDLRHWLAGGSFAPEVLGLNPALAVQNLETWIAQSAGVTGEEI